MRIMNGRFHSNLFFIALIIILLLGLSIDFWHSAAAASSTMTESGDQQMYLVLFNGPTVVQKLAQDAEPVMNTQSASATRYQQDLLRQQDAAIGELSRLLKRPLYVSYQYTFALNGMAVALDAAEAKAIMAQSTVRDVVLSQNRTPQTDTSPDWIGASSLWDGSQTGGLPGTKGEGMVVGIIDTGINMDHPSFAAVGGDGYVHTNPNGAGNYLGHCAAQPGTFVCNDKLIGAYSWPEVGDNPEDYSSHGSNVAGIAVGNVLTVPYTAPTIVLTPTLSGVAPHANLIAYDVCEPTSSSGQPSTCPDYISIRAVEQAILDDVDVLNFSIGSDPSNPWQDPLSLAFLSAREAGIFVATAAGNSGPDAGTILAPANSPWMTTAANSTHNGRFNNTLTAISGGDTSLPLPVTGSSITGGHDPASIVLAPDSTCQTNFPAGTWTQDEIVLCRYSSSPNARTKADRVMNGGAGGVLIDVGHDVFQLMGIDRFNLPGINILQSDADALALWLSSGSDHVAEISGTERQHDDQYGDEIYRTSSRGPSLFIPDVLKPNVSAPGTLIWAAGRTTNSSIPPELSFYRGTSQASPHVAGTAVLLKALHPDWTPAEIESALMMTAQAEMTDYDGAVADAFSSGAGRIDLTAVARAGLVLHESGDGFRAANPAYGQDASQLNLASLTESACGDSCTWTRQFRSTLPLTTTWEVDITQPVTAVLTVTPTTFMLPPGGFQTIAVTAAAASSPTDTWDFGVLLLSESSQLAPDAHLPVTLKRSETQLPERIEIHTREETSSHLQTGLVAPGITALSAASYELVRGTVIETHVAQGETLTLTLPVPANSKQLVAEIISSSAVDVDLFVQKSGEAQGTACSSTGIWPLESCFVLDPDGSDYEISVQNVFSSGLPMDSVAIVTAVIPDGAAANSWVTGPVGEAITAPFDIRYFWQEPTLQPEERWYSGVELGSQPASPADIGFIPVLLLPHPEAVQKAMTPTQLTLASVLTATLSIQPNVTPMELTYILTETIPAGLTVMAVTAPTGTVTQDGEHIRWEVVLPPIGVETAVLQYHAVANAALCNHSVTSSLTFATDRPGSVPGAIDIGVDGNCYQAHLPLVVKENP